ncbi:vWA domain-containing protein [Actinocorallia longicatena]|uniref:vWA domain-containing protein n=1 Tax=Actinocorallia longicatena TaxID=111803 RepID=UPI003CD0B64D
MTVAEEPPPEIINRISLRKEAVKASLVKKGIPGVRARVAVVLDASGSMRRLYREGVVADVVERMAAIALQIDDDASLDAWIFATTFARLPSVQVGDLATWSSEHIKMAEATTADGTHVTLGGRNNEPEVIRDIIDFYADRPGEPVLILFYSDGGVARDAQIAKLLRDASDRPLFWQFIGLGTHRYGILERLDTLSGRLVDNAGFFSVDDIAALPDPALYDLLLSSFPAWLREAARHDIPLGTNRP